MSPFVEKLLSVVVAVGCAAAAVTLLKSQPELQTLLIGVATGLLGYAAPNKNERRLTSAPPAPKGPDAGG